LDKAAVISFYGYQMEKWVEFKTFY